MTLVMIAPIVFCVVVHGIDISERFVDLAREHAPDGATFERLDARDLFDDLRETRDGFCLAGAHNGSFYFVCFSLHRRALVARRLELFWLRARRARPGLRGS